MDIFFILVVFHLVADFALQGYSIGNKKRGLNKYMLWHIVITTLAFAIPSLFYFDLGWISKAIGVIFLTHLLIDVIRAEINYRFKLNAAEHNFWLLLSLDQILHVSVLYTVIRWL